MSYLIPDYKLFSPTYIWFQKYLEPRGISQKAFCEQSGIPPSTFTQMLKGKHSLTIDKCRILSDFVKIDIRIIIQLNHIFKCVTNIINGYPNLSKKQELIHQILHSS